MQSEEVTRPKQNAATHGREGRPEGGAAASVAETPAEPPWMADQAFEK